MNPLTLIRSRHGRRGICGRKRLEPPQSLRLVGSIGVRAPSIRAARIARSWRLRRRKIRLPVGGYVVVIRWLTRALLRSSVSSLQGSQTWRSLLPGARLRVPCAQNVWSRQTH
jgi:hypothetical protein